MGASKPSNSGRGERRWVRTYDGMQPRAHFVVKNFGRGEEIALERRRDGSESL